MPLLPSTQGAAAKVVTEAQQLQVVSFDELKPGATMRVLKENPPLIHAIDLAVVVTGNNAHDAARDIRRIPSDIFDQAKLIRRPQPNGGHPIKFVFFDDASELIMALGGRRARFFRKSIAEILVQHFDHNVDNFVQWTLDTAQQVEEEEAAREPEIKYVYGAESEAFPGLVKIGYATSLDARMEQANAFSAPLPFSIVAQVPSLDAKRDEAMAHVFFAKQREEGEFFRVSVQAVQNFFDTCILPMYNQESVLDN